MQIEILTIFPDYFRTPLQESLLGKAVAGGLLKVTVTDLRDFALDRHRKVDDEPYGGGAGMVMIAPVMAAAIEARRDAEGLARAWTVLLGPEGKRLDQAHVAELAARPRLLLVCGRYEGIDERVRQLGLYDEEVSLGDFVLPGGEAAALALTEAISRLVPGVVGTAESVDGGVLPGRPPGLPALHAAPRVSGPFGARGAPVREPPQDSELAAGDGAGPDAGAAAGSARAPARGAGGGGGMSRGGRFAPERPARLECAVSRLPAGPARLNPKRSVYE